MSQDCRKFSAPRGSSALSFFRSKLLQLTILFGAGGVGAARRRRNLKILCDTSVLPENIGDADSKSRKELEAVKELQKLGMFGSHLVRHEVMNTKDASKRDQLIAEQAALKPLPKDEKLLGFHTTSDQRGGFVCFPMIADVQDETIRTELIARGLKQRDAEHITQAVCNDCDVFLTRDERTIINPHRAWLEQRFPKLKVRLPSELLACIQKAGPRDPSGD